MEVDMSMLTAKTRVTEGGRIVIPAKIREALDIEIGENVTLEVDEDKSLRIKTSKEALRRLQKLVRQHVSPDRSIVDEFLKERREEAMKDE
jgi:AbrB family looped-hinge helix DNA binding protein